MQNDMLKNNIAPWQDKGRWYHGVYSHENGALISAKTDDFLLDTNNFILFTSGNYVYITPVSGSDLVIKECVVYPIGKLTISANLGGSLGGVFYMDTTRPNVMGINIGFTNTYVTKGDYEFWLFVYER